MDSGLEEEERKNFSMKNEGLVQKKYTKEER